MNHQDLEDVKARAGKSLQDVERLLDNPDHAFKDGTAETWGQQLKDDAERCREHGLGFLARQLESAAQRVQQRMEELCEW
jgi:hypothetical protein